MAVWTDLSNLAYKAVLSSTFVNTLLENTRYLKEKVEMAGSGVAYHATPLTANTTASSTEALAGVSVTFTAQAGVKYAILLTTRLTGSAADLRCGARVRRGTSLSDPQIGEILLMPNIANTGQTTEFTSYDTPGAGTVTYTVSYLTLGGSGNTFLSASATSPTTLMVRPA